LSSFPFSIKEGNIMNRRYLWLGIVILIIAAVVVYLAVIQDDDEEEDEDNGGDQVATQEVVETEEPVVATEEAAPATEEAAEATEEAAAPATEEMVATEEAAPAVTEEAAEPAATEEAAAPATEEAAAPATEEAAAAGATEEAAALGTGEVFRVAVVMPSANNDLAFSQSMYDALTQIQEARGEANFEFVVSENMFVVEDAATAIRDYATQGYDLVIAHGSQYGSSLQEIAPDFPETSFAWGTTVSTFEDEGITNVYAYEARSEEGGYVNGVMAAMLTESNVIGVIGPIETGDAKLYVDGFIAGVASVDPEIEVLVNWIGSFSDLSLASSAAETMIADGADVLTGTAQMVPGAVNQAVEAGALWFGTQSDQTSLAPEIVVASQVYDWTVVLDPIIDQVMAGELGGEAYAITLENSGLLIAYNADYALPEEVATAAEETIAGIVDGSITVPVEEVTQ
jgi:basic membrane protein A